MNHDFIPDNVELWIVNWKRKEALNQTLRSWLSSGFDFREKTIKVVSNHSSITQESIDQDLQPMVEVRRNVMRHDNSLGPTSRNYNEAYVHTFLTGTKKWCMCAHDNMNIKSGWSDAIKDSNYDLYIAPQGDQIHVVSLEGLRTFGWWDERYSSNGHHELDYLSRALHRCLNNKQAKASLVDIHWWENNSRYTVGNRLNYNDIGLSDFWERMDKSSIPQSGSKGFKFDVLCDSWQTKKWGTSKASEQGYQTTIKGVERGPLVEEHNWYCWLDLADLTVASVGIR